MSAERHLGDVSVSPVQAAPRSPAELFTAFTILSIQGFGGVLPIAQRELVERRRWLTREQFVELLAVSQVLPGPNVVNLSLIVGDRAFGTRGALSALAGMLLVPMLVVLLLAALYAEFARIPAVSGALRGMGAVAAGLVISTAFKLMATLRKSLLGVPLAAGFAAAMALATGWLHWPLVWVLIGLGSVACTIAWARLATVGPAAVAGSAATAGSATVVESATVVAAAAGSEPPDAAADRLPDATPPR